MATVYIISAPSGCGKTSLVQSLLKSMDNLALSVSCTTRKPRTAEVSGTHYYFVDVEQFKRMIQKDAFLEYASVLNYYYGTPRDWIMDTLNRGIDVIVVIDWQGAEQIRAQYKEAVSIAIMPPSLETLRERLINRGQDSESVIKARLQQAPFEIARCQTYQYCVVNDNFQEALLDLKAIIRANRLRANKKKVDS